MSQSQTENTPAPPVPGGPKLWLLRHGETEWSRSGQYTGLTDMPLTEAGEAQARSAQAAVSDVDFDLVLTSPLQRAHLTATLAGFPANGITAITRASTAPWFGRKTPGT